MKTQLGFIKTASPNNALVENKHKAIKLLWPTLSSKGKEYVSTKLQLSYSYCSQIVNAEKVDIDKRDLVYDMYQFCQERIDFEQAELKSKIDELQLQED